MLVRLLYASRSASEIDERLIASILDHSRTYNQEHGITGIEELSYQVAALTVDKYNKGDAERDKALCTQRMQYLKDRVTRVESTSKRSIR